MWVIKVNQRKLGFKCPLLFPPECGHERLPLLRVFGKYFHQRHLSPLLVGRKDVQQFLEILIHLQFSGSDSRSHQLIALWQLLSYLCKCFR